jgi:hypothetical protein
MTCGAAILTSRALLQKNMQKYLDAWRVVFSYCQIHLSPKPSQINPQELKKKIRNLQEMETRRLNHSCSPYPSKVTEIPIDPSQEIEMASRHGSHIFKFI